MTVICDVDGCNREADVGLNILRTKSLRWCCQRHLEAYFRAAELNGRSLADQIRASGAMARSRQHKTATVRSSL